MILQWVWRVSARFSEIKAKSKVGWCRVFFSSSFWQGCMFGELICECLLPLKTSWLCSLMDRRGGPAPTCILSVYSAHLPTADQNCCVISLGPFSGSYIWLMCCCCIPSLQLKLLAGSAKQSLSTDQQLSSAPRQGGNLRLSREGADMMPPKGNASAVALMNAEERTSTLCTATSLKVIWCVSMRTHLVNQAFSVPKNTSPNCSGHFKHFSHPHGKKRSSQ